MRTLPDVTSHTVAEIPSTLKWVGMEDIAVPIKIATESDKVVTFAAKADVYVSLDSPTTKGIHMSRLHSVVNQLAERDCNKLNLDHLLDQIINSQGETGESAKIKLSFDLLLKKSALVSEEFGYQTYPVSIVATKSKSKFSCDFEITIPYSSTCPCSASLARQLLASRVDSQFPNVTVNKTELVEWIQSLDGSVATPHSQRSYAYLKLSIGSNNWPTLSSLIFQLEKVIGTPVQTAVKRIDEQEFAKLNAENLMFCEDAARKIKKALEGMRFIKDYWFKVEHQESLHAHNAVVVDQKY